MATYVILGKWTPQTFQHFKDAAATSEEIKKFIKSMGAEIKGWYSLMGRFDEVCILEAPDDETVGKIVLTASAKFAVQTETMRAFNEEETLKLMAAMG